MNLEVNKMRNNTEGAAAAAERAGYGGEIPVREPGV